MSLSLDTQGEILASVDRWLDSTVKADQAQSRLAAAEGIRWHVWTKLERIRRRLAERGADNRRIWAEISAGLGDGILSAAEDERRTYLERAHRRQSTAIRFLQAQGEDAHRDLTEAKRVHYLIQVEQCNLSDNAAAARAAIDSVLADLARSMNVNGEG